MSEFMAPELLVAAYLSLYDLNNRASIASVGAGMMWTLQNISTKQSTLYALLAAEGACLLEPEV